MYCSSNWLFPGEVGHLANGGKHASARHGEGRSITWEARCRASGSGAGRRQLWQRRRRRRCRQLRPHAGGTTLRQPSPTPHQPTTDAAGRQRRRSSRYRRHLADTDRTSRRRRQGHRLRRVHRRIGRSRRQPGADQDRLLQPAGRRRRRQRHEHQRHQRRGQVHQRAGRWHRRAPARGGDLLHREHRGGRSAVRPAVRQRRLDRRDR